MTSFRLGMRFGKWTLIPLGLTLLISSVQLVGDRSSEDKGFTNFDRFTLTNTAGLLLTVLLEILKRWSAEERIIKLTNHLDTGSPIFQNVVNLIEDIDAVVRRSRDVSRLIDEESNPVIQRLQSSLAHHSETLRVLKELKVVTDYTNSRLTNRLTETVDRILGLSDPATDMEFWRSPEGEASWEAQKHSLAMKKSDYSKRADTLPQFGVCRIFVLPKEFVLSELECFLDTIVEQVCGGVIASVLMDGQHQRFEFAIFGDIAYRSTDIVGVNGEKVNTYGFDPEEVSKKLQIFQVLWNSAWRVYSDAAASRETYTRDDLIKLLRSKGFKIA